MPFPNMGTMGTEFPTLLDFKQQYATTDILISEVCELLYKSNPMFEDFPWKAGNQLTGDTFFIRTELPTAHSRMVNQGIRSSTSKTTQYTETTEEYVTRFEADVHAMNELFQGSGEANAYLSSEERPHVYVLGETVLNAMLYGNNASGVRGFMTRLSSPTKGEYKDQVLDASKYITPTAQPRFRSILFIKWEPNEITGIHNKYGTAGLDVKRYEDTVHDREGLPFRAYVSEYHWHCGLRVRDRRYLFRIANIDLNAFEAPDIDIEKQNQNFRRLFELMLRAKNQIRQVGGGETVAYMSKDLYTPIEMAAYYKENLALSYEHIQASNPVTRFAGIRLSMNEIMDFDEDKVA